SSCEHLGLNSVPPRRSSDLNDAGSFTPIGRRGIDVVREVFARSFVVAPLVASRLAEQEARRLVLTKDQMRVLDFLRSHRRVAVRDRKSTRLNSSNVKNSYAV